MPDFLIKDIEPEKSDRKAGFLTETTRKYLLGEWEAPDLAQERSKRNEIKGRTRHALADLALLHEHADEDLKKSIIRMSEDERLFEPDQKQHLIDGMIWLAMEASTGEQFADTMKQAIEPAGLEVNDNMGVITEALNDNWIPYLRDHFSDLGKELNKDSNVHVREAVEALRSSWPR